MKRHIFLVAGFLLISAHPALSQTENTDVNQHIRIENVDVGKLGGVQASKYEVCEITNPKFVRTAEGQKVLPSVGLGPKRTLGLVSFPVKHPVEFTNKFSFPFRHPLVAFYRFGKGVEPYQPALNALGSVGCMAAPFVYGFKATH
jgi:hypothetical protein